MNEQGRKSYSKLVQEALNSGAYLEIEHHGMRTLAVCAVIDQQPFTVERRVRAGVTPALDTTVVTVIYSKTNRVAQAENFGQITWGRWEGAFDIVRRDSGGFVDLYGMHTHANGRPVMP